MKKRLLAGILTLCMLLTLFPAGAFAAEGSTDTTASDMTAVSPYATPDREEPVYAAQIGQDTDKRYETLSEAIEAATSGETVYLLKNVTLEKTQTIREDLTLDLQGHTIKGEIKITSGQVKIKNGAIEAVKKGISLDRNTPTVTLEGLSVSGEYGIYSGAAGVLSINNCNISGKQGIYSYDVGSLSISDCTISGTSTEAVFMSNGGQVSIENSTLASEAEGKPALTTGWNFSGELTLGAGNTVTGFVNVAGNPGQSLYTVIVEGGRFDNGDALPFQQHNDDTAEMLKRLHLRGGSFKTDVSALVDIGYQCIPSEFSDDGYTYEVVWFDGLVTDFYSKDADGQRTYYETFEKAVEAGKTLGTMIYVTANTEITDPAALQGVTFTTLGDGKLSYNGTLEEFLAGGAVLNNASLDCSDADISSAKTKGGKLAGGVVSDRNQWEAVVPRLHEDALICGDQTIGEIMLQTKDNFTARIGRVGYFRLGNAFGDATDNDSDSKKIKDEIILLKDTAVTSMNYITTPYSSFTLDLNNCTVSGAGISITKNSKTQNEANHADITLKNGTITASENYGVSINGSLSGVKLELIDLNVSADGVTDGAAAYLAGGDTVITGGSYLGETGIQLCAGSLAIDGATVTSTGSDRSGDKEGKDGLISDGAAVSVVNRDYPDGIPQLTLKSGTFTSADGVDAVKAYTWNTDDNIASEWEGADQAMEIDGGNFSTPVNPEYLSDSLKFEVYNPSKNAEAPYSYYPNQDQAKDNAEEDGLINDLSNRAPDAETFTLTLKYYDGKEQSIMGRTFILPVNPFRAGYTFLGWYDGGEKVSEEITLTADKILEARWRNDNPSSGSGSGSYSITVDKDIRNGTVTVSPKNPFSGQTVTVTVQPENGYELDKLIVTDKNGSEIKLTDKGSGKFTFKMPVSRVKVNARFRLIDTPVFADVPGNAYYADAVAWAVAQGITSGTTPDTFSPDASCTRAQMVTFLWRANGSPKADGTNPFTDVSADAYYYDAVLWAAEKDITSGTTAATFNPDAVLTRGQAVTFLWRANGSPAVSGSSFGDVAADAYYADAVAWAVSENITTGTGGNSFSPDANCTRAQIVTFMYRDVK